MTLTVRQLQEILDECPDDYIVILSSDSEGNSYSPAHDVYLGTYVPESDYSGYILDEEEDSKETKNAIILWPTN